ncbi:DUF1592 domain-containing protein [Flavilitoribacter nigricans]|uniref:DUF1592 domain-containing protein n=1 Tax=Flavilitoribacter nigricans (strain ATCC 23147 / DSM 23189 / NBRC 102662 / NCIMB 1420 / SS-2) TaxID=1122177 RepID=A0A2D0N4K3_FLAN2|nr:DUF1592 domain-containing protein [Flavilitoribacter nigricans]PHN03415.1 hypothetical protein CRP01_27415 [Flavilitoribacter nigricans DSM 23189 = NBRC 102662]
MRFALITCLALGLFTSTLSAAGYPPDQIHYWDVVMPIMRKYCNQECHNADDLKGGLNLERYDFISRIQRDGELFTSLIRLVENGEMPPENKLQMPAAEQDTLLSYIKKYLKEALAIPNPGQIPPRRLSMREYAYAIQDLTGVSLDPTEFFPKDPSGGEGFDNFARVLYLNPLLMERYLEATEYIVEEAYCNVDRWERIVPGYRQSLGTALRVWWQRVRHDRDISLEGPLAAAETQITDFATRAYRRILLPQEKQKLLDFFTEVYLQLPAIPERFDISMQQVFKAVLLSPNFLIRQENDRPTEDPYLVSSFEMASRLSFFLWSSIPDDTLMQAAYRDELLQPELLRVQITRMLRSPKLKRMAESFASQWLEIDKLADPSHSVDDKIFPEYSPDLGKWMQQEAVDYFYYTLTGSNNLLELIDGRYTFLNEPLAEHYGIEGIDGENMRRVQLDDPIRGGVLGMGGVLTATSLPHRTSPVLRGKWVLEKILGTPAKAPPPDVPELEEAKKTNDEMALRELLTIHRANPACQGCHQEMDDLGFALENFDAIGRWRDSYGMKLVDIDASGIMKSGEAFNGPVELKALLRSKKAQFAKSFSQKVLGFALGRGIDFKDSKTVAALSETLLENDFDASLFLTEVAMSYPFRYKLSDPVVVQEF